MVICPAVNSSPLSIVVFFSSCLFLIRTLALARSPPSSILPLSPHCVPHTPFISVPCCVFLFQAGLLPARGLRQDRPEAPAGPAPPLSGAGPGGQAARHRPGRLAVQVLLCVPSIHARAWVVSSVPRTPQLLSRCRGPFVRLLPCPFHQLSHCSGDGVLPRSMAPLARDLRTPYQ